MTRKLASVQIIKNIQSIDGADRIEIATVLGWHVVVKKNEFKVGDKVVYFEIDSILPSDNPEFDFLKNSKGKISPLKTRRMMGIFSQGLIMPISILKSDTEPNEGDDLTEILNVHKKEDEVIEVWCKKPKAFKQNTFPYFIPKTDEERIQNLQEELNEAKDHIFVVTEKLDGTSFTAYIKDGEFNICSRNMTVNQGVESPYSFISKKYDLENKFKTLREILGFDFAIQGEIIGPSIQKNKYALTELDCYLFNFFDIDDQKHIGFNFNKENSIFDLYKASEYLGMKTVPILKSDFKMINDIDALVDYSVGKSVLKHGQEREGVVFRLKNNEELSHFGERISFKAINPYFLIKE